MRGAPLASAIVLLCGQLAFAAPADDHGAQLKELRQRIGSLNRELRKNNQTKAQTASQLRGTETAIAQANRRLRELGQQQATAQAELLRLEQQSASTAAQIETQRRQLSLLLYRQYVEGDTDALKLLLAGEDPNQMARDRYFVTALSRAKARLLSDLKQTLETQQLLAGQVQAKKEELADIGHQQEESRAVLLAEQKQRQDQLAQITGRIEAQRREIRDLQANEQRLSRLIEGLARAAPRAARPRKTPPVPALRNQEVPQTGPTGEFADLRGKLRLPVKGEILNRFGSPRADGGATWKGLFIRASEGSEVKAVAAGRVVFADWLRGFGNLLIVDHGDGYLSIYGNNQTLYRSAGNDVKSGETIAAVGNSGGNAESGLYFELRQQGQPLDPLKWARIQ